MSTLNPMMRIEHGEQRSNSDVPDTSRNEVVVEVGVESEVDPVDARADLSQRAAADSTSPMRGSTRSDMAASSTDVVDPAAAETRDDALPTHSIEEHDESVGTSTTEEQRCCRICYEPIAESDCESTAAPPDPEHAGLVLECSCKGDLRNVHVECARKWFSMKGEAVCEICNVRIRNVVITDAIDTAAAAPGGSRRSRNQTTDVAAARRNMLVIQRRDHHAFMVLFINSIVTSMLLAVATGWFFALFYSAHFLVYISMAVTLAGIYCLGTLPMLALFTGRIPTIPATKHIYVIVWSEFFMSCGMLLFFSSVLQGPLENSTTNNAAVLISSLVSGVSMVILQHLIVTGLESAGRPGRERG